MHSLNALEPAKYPLFLCMCLKAVDAIRRMALAQRKDVGEGGTRVYFITLLSIESNSTSVSTIICNVDDNTEQSFYF